MYQTYVLSQTNTVQHPPDDSSGAVLPALMSQTNIYLSSRLFSLWEMISTKTSGMSGHLYRKNQHIKVSKKAFSCIIKYLEFLFQKHKAPNLTLNKQSFFGVACCTSEKTKRLKDLERPNCVGVWRPWAAGLSRKYKEWTLSDEFTTHLILLKSVSIMSCTLISDIMMNTPHVGLTGSCGVRLCHVHIFYRCRFNPSLSFVFGFFRALLYLP